MTTKNSTMACGTIFAVIACCAGLAFCRILENNDNLDDISRINNDRLIVNPVLEPEIDDIAAGTVKEKRCPRVGAASPGPADIVGAVNAQPVLRRDLHDHVNKQLCKACKNRHTCKVMHKCDSCKSWCDSVSEDSTEISNSVTEPIPEPVVGASLNQKSAKQRHQIITVQAGTIKDELSSLLGISNKDDIDTLGCWALTKTNNPPVVNWNQQGIVQANNPVKDVYDDKQLANEIIKEKEALKDQMKTTLLNRIHDLGRKLLPVEEIKKIIEDTAREFSYLPDESNGPENSVMTRARNNFEQEFLPRFPIEPLPESIIVPQMHNPAIIEGPPDMTKIVGSPLNEENSGVNKDPASQSIEKDSLPANTNEAVHILEVPVREPNQQKVPSSSQILQSQNIDDSISKTSNSDVDPSRTDLNQELINVHPSQSFPEKNNLNKFVNAPRPFAKDHQRLTGKAKAEGPKSVYRMNKLLEDEPPAGKHIVLNKPIFEENEQITHKSKNEENHNNIAEHLRFSEPEDNDLLTQQQPVDQHDKDILDPEDKMYQMEHSNFEDDNFEQEFPELFTDKTLTNSNIPPDEISRLEPQQLDHEPLIDSERTINQITDAFSQHNIQSEPEIFTDKTVEHHISRTDPTIRPFDVVKENLQQSESDIFTDQPIINPFSTDSQTNSEDVLGEINRQSEPQIFASKSQPGLENNLKETNAGALEEGNLDEDNNLDTKPEIEDTLRSQIQENLEENPQIVNVLPFTEFSKSLTTQQPDILNNNFQETNLKEKQPEARTRNLIKKLLEKKRKEDPYDSNYYRLGESEPKDLEKDEPIHADKQNSNRLNTSDTPLENQPQTITHKLIKKLLEKKRKEDPHQPNYYGVGQPEPKNLEKDPHSIKKTLSSIPKKHETIFTDKKKSNHVDTPNTASENQPEALTHKLKKLLDKKRKEDPYAPNYYRSRKPEIENKLGSQMPNELEENSNITDEMPSTNLHKNIVDQAEPNIPNQSFRETNIEPSRFTLNKPMEDQLKSRSHKLLKKLEENRLKKLGTDDQVGYENPTELKGNNQHPSNLKEIKEDNLPNMEVIPDLNNIKELPHKTSLKKFRPNKNRLNQYPPNFQTASDVQNNEKLGEPLSTNETDNQQDNIDRENIRSSDNIKEINNVDPELGLSENQMELELTKNEHRENQDHNHEEKPANMFTRIADEEIDEKDDTQDFKDIENVLGDVKDISDKLQETVTPNAKDTDTENSNTDPRHINDEMEPKNIEAIQTEEPVLDADDSSEQVIDEIKKIPLQLLHRAEKTFEDIENYDNIKANLGNGSEIVGSQPLENSLELYQSPYSHPARYPHKERFPAYEDRLLGVPLEADTEGETKPTQDWSNSLGVIAPATSEIDINMKNPQEMYFIGNGIKLPLHMVKKDDGAIHLAVDLDKLCSCKNISCHKNESAIAETVGTILEKEAELKELVSDKQENFEDMPLGMASPNFNNVKLENRFASDSVELQHENPDISKRSPTESVAINNKLLLQPSKVSTKNNTVPTLKINTPKLSEFVRKATDNSPNIIQQTSNYLKDFVSQGIKSGMSNIENINPLAASQEIIKKFVSNLSNSNISKDKTPTSEVPQRTTDDENSLRTRLRNLFNRPDRTSSTELVDNNSNTEPPNLESRLRNVIDKSIKSNKDGNSASPIIARVDDNINLSNAPIVTSGRQHFADSRGNEKYDELLSVTKPYQFKEAKQLEEKLAKIDASINDYNKQNEELIKKEANTLLKATENSMAREEVGIMNNFLTWLKGVISDKKN